MESGEEGILAFGKGEKLPVLLAGVADRLSVHGNHDDPRHDQGDDSDDLDHGKPEPFPQRAWRRQFKGSGTKARLGSARLELAARTDVGRLPKARHAGKKQADPVGPAGKVAKAIAQIAGDEGHESMGVVVVIEHLAQCPQEKEEKDPHNRIDEDD